MHSKRWSDVQRCCRIDQDLVNDQKPWCGSRLFGMCFSSQEGMAAIGTTLYITGHDRLPDGRLLIATKGMPWPVQFIDPDF